MSVKVAPATDFGIRVEAAVQLAADAAGEVEALYADFVAAFGARLGCAGERGDGLRSPGCFSRE